MIPAVPGLARQIQNDFSAGEYGVNQDASRYPKNGASLIMNGVISEEGVVYRRGGSTLFPGGTWPSTQIVWVWQGALAGGARTLVATASTIYTVSGSGVTVGHASTTFANGPRSVAVSNGIIYFSDGVTYDGTTWGTSGPGGYLTVVANRIVKASDKVYFSSINGGSGDFATDDFWLIPAGATITGLAPLRDACVVFTDRGTWVISNMAYNLIDGDGNVQQRLDLYSPDLVLAGPGASGVVGWNGGLIVPARDGVWLMQLGVTSEVAEPLQLLSRPINSAYRSLLDFGYVPGQAAVHRGYLFLPLLHNLSGGAALNEQMYVCNLGLAGHPWTEFNFDEGGGAVALTRSSDGSSLLGSTRITSPMSPISKLATMNFLDSSASSTEADGKTNWFVLETPSLQTGSFNQNVAVKARLSYALRDLATDDPEIEAWWRPDFSGSITALSGTAPENDVTGGTFTWPIGKRCRSGALRIRVKDPGTLRVRGIEVFTRQSGRV